MHTPWQLVLLFATGVFAGFVDSIAGGGGLITLPVLLSFGGDTRHILGANKLQATCGSASAAAHYARAKQVSLQDTLPICASTFTGACLGTWAILHLDPLLVKRVIPVVLVAVVVYVLLKPDLGHIDSHPRMTRPRFDLLFGLGLGSYDGFIGPGVGSFWTMAFVLVKGFNLIKATAYTKVVNLSSNLASLLFFLFTRNIYVAAGVAMGVGQILGARFGSRMVVKSGVKFIRPVFITVVLGILMKLLYDVYFRS